MTGSGPVAAFLRFVLCGGGVTLLGSGALLLVGDRVPLAAANAVVAVATTVLATELHGRITFRRGRADWRDHAAGGLTVLLSYLFTTGALLAFAALHPSAGALLRQAVYLTASGAAGLARFLLLRCVVFARRPEGVRPQDVRAGAAGPASAEPLPVSAAAAVPVSAVSAAAAAPGAVRAVIRQPVRKSGQAGVAARIGRDGVSPAAWARAAASPREPAPSLPRMLAT